MSRNACYLTSLTCAALLSCMSASAHAACVREVETDCNYFDAITADSLCASLNNTDHVALVSPVGSGETGVEQAGEGCGTLVNPGAITSSGGFIGVVSRGGLRLVIRVWRLSPGGLGTSCGQEKPGAACKEP